MHRNTSRGDLRNNSRAVRGRSTLIIDSKGHSHKVVQLTDKHNLMRQREQKALLDRHHARLAEISGKEANFVRRNAEELRKLGIMDVDYLSLANRNRKSNSVFK